MSLRPASTVGYMVDHAARDAILTAKGRAVFAFCQATADALYLGFGELCARVALALRHATHYCGKLRTACMMKASFAFRVAHVVCVRAKEQMRGFHARRIVAMVADEQTVGDLADEQLVGNPMSRSITENPVTAFFFALLVPAGPDPTRATAVHFGEECCDCFIHPRIIPCR